MKQTVVISLCFVVSVFAQYSPEINVRGNGYAQIDIDNDGQYELSIVSSNGLTFYNGDYSACWNIPRINSSYGAPYTYMTYAIPRDINNDGIVVPTNTDNDANGELIVAYYTWDPTYEGKFRVYDAITHNLEWESPFIKGYVYPYVEDLDGDNRSEIIINRSGSAESLYVYAYSGTGVDDNQYNRKFATAVMQNPITASSFPKGQFPIYDIMGRIKSDRNIQKGVYFIEYEGKKVKVVVE